MNKLKYAMISGFSLAVILWFYQSFLLMNVQMGLIVFSFVLMTFFSYIGFSIMEYSKRDES
ncbi:hypothetical protein DH09_03615 [Bacillaceae bacterium JMAK1]|nr:hypothetical protein DH09_03615 [Bacillaceae bacterium JMAK1]